MRLPRLLPKALARNSCPWVPSCSGNLGPGAGPARVGGEWVSLSQSSSFPSGPSHCWPQRFTLLLTSSRRQTAGLGELASLLAKLHRPVPGTPGRPGSSGRDSVPCSNFVQVDARVSGTEAPGGPELGLQPAWGSPSPCPQLRDASSAPAAQGLEPDEGGSRVSHPHPRAAPVRPGARRRCPVLEPARQQSVGPGSPGVGGILEKSGGRGLG